MALSAVLAGLSAAGGLIAAFYLDWPPSGTIVLVSGVLFLILFASRQWVKRPGRTGSSQP